VLNAANEVAVEAFLRGIEETITALPAGAADDLEAILAADGEARRKATKSMANLLGRAA